MMPSAPAAIFFVLAALVQEMTCISVPTGKKTPITPAKVTPRPTYHPPVNAPAPVHEYTYDNPEPAPLDPSWIPIPVKYLNVLTANSILYIPMRIPNPAAAQPTYAVPVTKKPVQQVETTVPPTYETQSSPSQQYTNSYQKQAEQQYTTTYQAQPEQYTTSQNQLEQQQYTSYQKEPEQQDKQLEYGAKVVPKQKWKPYYYLPKGQYKQATKAGYPKKALAASSQKYYYYYPIASNAQ